MSTLVLKKMPGGVATPRLYQQKSNKKGVILIGTPCTGKTDVARLLSSRGSKHYSSSTALNAYAVRNNRQDIIHQMKSGELVSDLEVLKKVSGQHYQDFIRQIQEGESASFDGWGRIAIELNYALDCLYSYGEIHVCFLDASDECLWERSRRRGRNDDVSIGRRIAIYRENVETLQTVVDWRLGPQFCHSIDTTHINQSDVFRQLYSEIWSD